MEGKRLKFPSTRLWRTFATRLPPPNFIILHYAYFIGVCLVSSVIFWGASTPSRSISYTDSLFLVVSAMTLAGLNTINLSQINTFQQIMLFLLIIFGSAILVSIVVVFIRRRAFEQKFKTVLEQKRGRSNLMHRVSFSRSRKHDSPGGSAGLDLGAAVNSGGTPQKNPNMEEGSTDLHDLGAHEIEQTRTHQEMGSPGVPGNAQQSEKRDARPEKPSNIDTQVSRRITFASATSPTRRRQQSPLFHMQGVGARGDILNHPRRSRSFSNEILPNFGHGLPNEDSKPQSGYDLLSSVLVGRNSQFSNLTLAEREKLGGVEYQAVSILAVIVPVYFVLWQLLGCIGLGAYIAMYESRVTEVNGENPWWVGAFNGVSAFNNSGMSLLDANMVAFQTVDYILITMGLMILAGNTCYPIFLRLILWTMWKLLPDAGRWHGHRLTLRFLLDHPRRCYTNLFPPRHTWWLVAAVIGLNCTDWAAFEVLNIGNPTVSSLPHGARSLDGLFQAFAVRSGGFYVVPIANLRIGLLILYVIMMYISVYPVVITMRSSNVYEERSLGIYADDTQPPSKPLVTVADEKGENSRQINAFSIIKRTLSSKPRINTNNALGSGAPESRSYFVRQQLRGQLAHDLWWIVLAVLFINIIETSQFERDPVTYSVFNILFEVVSAYGCVGISVGLPNVAYSFCGGWHVLSKLILCAVMLRGRHRGLPVAIDRAVLLPGEHLAVAEEEDAQIRADRARAGPEGVVGSTLGV